MNLSELDPTGHLTAQFPDVEEVVQHMDTAHSASFTVKRREIRIRWTNGVCLEGYMASATAYRFAKEAMDSPLVASVWLGSEL